MPSDEIMEWIPFWKPPGPEITRRISKALRRKGFSLAKEFCWNSEHENAYTGKRTNVDEVVAWLMKEFDVVKDDKQYPGFVNLLHKERLIQVQDIGIGKYKGRILVVLPHDGKWEE